MGTRSAGPDAVAVESLAAGALQWIRLHSGYLDSPSGRAELPVTPRVKALLQLALLRRSWERAAPSDPGLAEVTGTVERVWRSPAHPALLVAEPRYAWQFKLMYGALAPAGLTDGPHRTALAEVTAGGFLTPGRKSPFLHLETRFYADLAGVGHRLHSYRRLYEASRLARHRDGQPVGEPDVCDVTHTLFHLSDFGFRDPGLTGDALEHARDLVCRLTGDCVRNGDWDLTAKLVLAQHCLGLDPLGTPSGEAGLRLLGEVQSPGGAVPGRSAADRADTTATTAEFFRKAYQATLVTALTALTVAHGRRGGAPDAGPPDGARAAGGSAGPPAADDATGRDRAPATRGAR
ncbi:DUF6895 family protein [Kitasatospora sp. NPDC058201]|uniref:DUF6895 family protein n=1 Tax=unclassified Kitasatospora TaxID=2633591 RepID=UPI0036646453